MTKLNVAIAWMCGVLAASAHAATSELVLVGDAGNAGKKLPFKDISNPYPRGGVDYPYRIGKNEVSNGKYAAFLNACAGQSDPFKLYHEGMKIRRTGPEGRWQYTPEPGQEYNGVRFVSRVNAARYCNYLTTGRPDAGAYTVKPMVRENGEVHEAIIGYRDMTFPDQPTLYFLPDMHEFYKAGWYDGKAGYREITPENREEPSHYGVLKAASGVNEWMENKYYGGSALALGADDRSADPDALSTRRIYQQNDYTCYEHTGFRVAATAPLQIADRLNRANNFFFSADDKATLRIRHEGAEAKKRFQLELRNFAAKPVWSREVDSVLKPGVNELPIALPPMDGYYELIVAPKDPLFNGQTVVIPLAVMREAMPAVGPNGRFGLTCHITRRERRFSFETFDFELLRRLGVSHARVETSFDDIDGSQSAVRRVRQAGINPLVTLRRGGFDDLEGMARRRAEHPELVAKWAREGIHPDHAWYAEQVYQLVSQFKGVVRDWEFGNEPTYWKNVLPEQYAQILKTGHKAAKMADPDCNVMAGDLNAIHAGVLSVKGGDFCDSIASHIYGFYVPMFWGVAGKMRELNGWKDAAGIADKPVWLTEIGGCTYNAMHMIPVQTLDEVRRYQAIHQPKIMAGGLAFGADKVLPYNFRDVPVDYLEEEFGMIDRFGRPKPAVASFRTTARLLGDARFAGFIKGHSMEEGKIAGLAFQDSQKRDVAVFWRNDPYGYSKYDLPFLKIIKPAETVKLKSSSSQVELINCSGGTSTLAVKNGIAEIPVSEYPVFVRGRLHPEFGDVQRAHPVAKLNLPPVAVKILPNYPFRSCDLMSGAVLKFTRGQMHENIKVNVFNLKNTTMSGTVRLVPMNNWREWPWPVEPSRQPVEIAANSFADVSFKVPVPTEYKPDQLFYLHAIFEDSAGGQTKDTVVFRVIEKEFVFKDWITYAKGFKIAPADNNRQIEITWDQERESFASLYLRKPTPFADNAAGLNSDIVLPFQCSGKAVAAVSMLMMDKDNEIFQLKQTLTVADDAWTSVRFSPAAILQKGVIIHKGGNQKVDFPVRLLGFNFNIKNGVNAGVIRVKPYENAAPAQAPQPAAGGGAVDMN